MTNSKTDKKIKQEILDEIIVSVRKIKYGELVISVHDSRIVQIETRQKKRFVK